MQITEQVNTAQSHRIIIINDTPFHKPLHQLISRCRSRSWAHPSGQRTRPPFIIPHPSVFVRTTENDVSQCSEGFTDPGVVTRMPRCTRGVKGTGSDECGTTLLSRSMSVKYCLEWARRICSAVAAEKLESRRVEPRGTRALS